jgi:YidC/Oxa1 family membrane protein insertase
LGLGKIIVYNLGGCCATCTFAWLANGLLAFLGFIHTLVRDWGLAIMVLVAIVRTILHPLTKGSQVNMMKLSKQMGALQPELDKLKVKYKDNPTKLNQEMMALYRERGVNPASMGLGCLPMFLQMPIWVALYAMLYFAIELRHEPAFWGVFQSISGGQWPFLADLSSADHFLPLPASWHFRVPLFGQTLTSVNILPILMGIVFFVQQKYMTPPNPNMSPEMRQQQTMMKWMTVILFPLMLFWAPSGLTLYILTSTTVGIIESKRVRKHVKELEESGKLHEVKPRKSGGLMERLMRAAESRQKAIEEQSKMQQRSGKKKNRP